MAARRTAPVVTIQRCDLICAAAGECCFERAYQIGRLDERARRPYSFAGAAAMNERTNALYDVAREVCHRFGLPWTDPRTGRTSQPPRAKRRKEKT